MLSREKDKLDKALGGIKDMGGVPSLIFVIDTNKEALAIKEAQRLGIPVAAIVDTNCDPDGIAFPVPANDDAGRAIALYCDLIARAALDGIGRSQGHQGIDIGASEEPMAEELPAPANTNEPAAEPVAEAGPEPAEAEPTEEFELPERSARRAGRPHQAYGRRAAARQEAERCRHLPLLASRRHEAGRR